VKIYGSCHKLRTVHTYYSGTVTTKINYELFVPFLGVSDMLASLQYALQNIG